MSFNDTVAFDGTEINGGLFLLPDKKGNPCSIEGEARFPGAHIGGQVNFVNVDFKGEVYFSTAKIDADVNILGTTAPGLIVEAAHFTKLLTTNSETVITDLILNYAKVGTLDIHWEKVSGKVEVTGCEYDSVSNREGLLNVLLAKGIGERQPYEFLENHCRQIGEVDFANKVYYKHCLLVSPSWEKLLESPYWRNFTSVLWDRLLRYTAGYGVRPSRLLWWVGVSFVLAFLMFKCPWFVKSVGGFIERTPPCGVAIWLSVKALMPFGTSVEYTANDVWRWQPTLVGAISFNILKILVWVGISAGTMSVGGLFRRYSK